jgi:hypothetical protein
MLALIGAPLTAPVMVVGLGVPLLLPLSVLAIPATGRFLAVLAKPKLAMHSDKVRWFLNAAFIGSLTLWLIAIYLRYLAPGMHPDP